MPPPMVVLPKHLIPNKLGGTGDGEEGIEFEEELTNAQVRDKYSTLKKRRGKEEMVKEAEKQGKDA